MAGWAAGVFTRARNWVNDKNGAINPQAALFDQEDDNFATGLNNCVTKDGLNKPSAAMDWNGQNLTNIAALGFTGDATGRGVSVCKVKSSDTSRISTTTLTDDPHLLVALAAGKFYSYELLLIYDGTTSAGMGIKLGLFYTGTILNVGAAFVDGNSFGPGLLAPAVSTVTGTTGVSAASVSTTANGVVERISGTFVTANAGNLSLQWAQFASTANNLNLRIGSYLMVTPLA